MSSCMCADQTEMLLDLQGTHVVLSEFINGDLGLHEVVVEYNDFPAEGPLFLLVMLGLQRQKDISTSNQSKEKTQAEVKRKEGYEARSVKRW